ncbi:MAG TPA: alpha/beta hydrolase [Acidimicrobiales bacterium]|nr:alpha/beta hydrolase [Acidimicrobiales bacterium]
MIRPLVADVAGDGAPVVLLHGQPGVAANWWRVAPLLGDRYRVVTPDRLGYGRTGGSAAGFAANARAVLALLDRLALPSAVLVGHSWAGAVALWAAVVAPRRIDGLVLVSSVAPGGPVGRLDRLLARRPVGELTALATVGAGARLVRDRRARTLARRLLPASGWDLVAHSTPGPGAWRAFAVEQRALVDELAELRPMLGSVVAPAVVVHGTADRVVAPRDGRLLAAALPAAELRLVEGGGHLLPWDHPAAVAAAIDEVAGDLRR